MKGSVRSVSRIFAVVAAVAVGTAFASGAMRAEPAAGSGAAGSGAPADFRRVMAVGDFNRDGIADLAEAMLPTGDRSGLATLAVSLGQPDGSYRPLASHPVLGHSPRSLVAGDFNGDGIPDLIAGDDDGALTLFLGDGTGRLAPAGEIAHFDSVVSVAVADFNHDGIPDLALSDWRASSVRVLLGVGDGSFRRGDSFPLRMRGTVGSVTTADFNGDGIPDLAVVYDKDDGATFDVMVGRGDGTFTAAPELSFVRDPNSHCPT